MTAAVVTYGHTLWARHCQAWQPSPPPRGTSTPPAPPAQACRLVDQRGESRTGTDTGPSNVRAARNCQATYPVSLPQGLSHRLQTCLQVPWSRQEGWASLRPWSVLCQHQPCSHPTGLSLLWTTPAKGPRPLGGGPRPASASVWSAMSKAGLLKLLPPVEPWPPSISEQDEAQGVVWVWFSHEGASHRAPGRQKDRSLPSPLKVSLPTSR